MMKKKEPLGDDVTEVGLDLEALSKKGEPPPEEPLTEISEETAQLSEDVPVKLVAVLGKKNLVLKDLLKFKVGQTIDLERAPNEFVDLTANGKLVAKGELVEIDGKLGVRIIKMIR